MYPSDRCTPPRQTAYLRRKGVSPNNLLTRSASEDESQIPSLALRVGVTGPMRGALDFRLVFFVPISIHSFNRDPEEFAEIDRAIHFNAFQRTPAASVELRAHQASHPITARRRGLPIESYTQDEPPFGSPLCVAVKRTIAGSQETAEPLRFSPAEAEPVD